MLGEVVLAEAFAMNTLTFRAGWEGDHDKAGIAGEGSVDDDDVGAVEDIHRGIGLRFISCRPDRAEGKQMPVRLGRDGRSRRLSL